MLYTNKIVNRKSIRLLIAFIAAISLTPQSYAQQTQDPENSNIYYYFDQPTKLVLNTTNIAIRKNPEVNNTIWLTTLKKYGLLTDDLLKWHTNNWWLVSLPRQYQSETKIIQLVKTISENENNNNDVIKFISPVFTGSDGGPVIVTSEILMAFDRSVSQKQALTILSEVPSCTIQNHNWANMPGAYKLQSTSKSGLEVLNIANSLARKQNVWFAQPNFIFTGQGTYVPNDPGFSNCWGINNTGQDGGTVDMDMDVLEAWDITKGESYIYIVIIDVGVEQDHPDINQRAGTDVTNDPNSNGTGGPVNQYDNHGTPVAGCATAAIDNNIGTVGVAPNCKSASVRTFIAYNDQGKWTTESAWTVDALAWAEQIGARITNNSNGYGFTDSAIDAKYSQTKNNGMIHFAATGNNGRSYIDYPSSISSVNAIGALERNGNRWSSSNYGNGLGFSAPGVSIYTTDRTGNDGWNTGDYTYATGTSFASPYAAGVAGLIISINPGLTPEEVEHMLQISAGEKGTPGYDTTYGWGFINASRSLYGFPEYEIIDLGTLGNPDGLSTGEDINNLTEIAGKANTGGFNPLLAFLYTDDTMINLGTLGGTSSVAYGLNDLSQVVGDARLTDESMHAFLWQNNNMQDLGTLGGTYSVAASINDFQQIAGYSATTGNLAKHAFIWQNNTMTDIGTLPAHTDSEAADINNLGQIVGSSTPAGQYEHAFIWENNSMSDLGFLANGAYAVAWAVNDLEQVVGEAEVSVGGPIHATLWQDGWVTSMSTLGGTNSKAYDINNSGTIVGWTETWDSVTALMWYGWPDTLYMININCLGQPSDWVLSIANAISDSGEITGSGTINGVPHAFLLKPPGLLLHAAIPGIAGQNNTFNATGATPSQRVYFIYSLSTGSANVPGCTGLTVGLKNPVIITFDEADALGYASISANVPNAASGLTVYLQAVEPANCYVSNVITFPVP